MSRIFEQTVIKNLIVKNRVVRSATNDYSGMLNGAVSDKQIKLYKELASNEVGMIITANFYCSYDGKMDDRGNSLHEDYSPKKLRELVSSVKEHGSVFIAQIAHAGGKTKKPMFKEYFSDLSGLTGCELKRISDELSDAAKRAKDVGFDGVQLHCAHGNLLSDFFNPMKNNRKDKYGGSAENRFLFIKECITKIQNKCGSDYPILIKININVDDETADKKYCGDLVYFLNESDKLGVCAIELSGYDFMEYNKSVKNYYLERAADLKGECSIPIILVGGIRSESDMNEVLDAGIDMVSFSRPLICEPDFVLKLKEGKKESQCISCNACFKLYKEKGKYCALHADT